MSRNSYTNAAFEKGTPEYFLRKADQHFEMAGLARQDNDKVDADRQLQLALDFQKKSVEAKLACCRTYAEKGDNHRTD